MARHRTGVLFDVDGTLIDTNYLHVVAWAAAFSEHGYHVPMARIHELIGQGSERLVRSALGHDDPDVEAAHADRFAPHLHELAVFDGAAALLREVKAQGSAVVLATSASKHDAAFFRAAIDADDVIDQVTTNDDADASKPEPDIVEAALDGASLEATDCLFVGDTVWDVIAAERAGMQCVGVSTGGIASELLRDAGAIAIYRDVASLLAEFAGSPLAALK